MANELNLFLLVLDPDEPVGSSVFKHDVVLRRSRELGGKFVVVKDRHGYFNIELPKEEPKRDFFDPDTVEAVVDAGARAVKKFVRGLGSR